MYIKLKFVGVREKEREVAYDASSSLGGNGEPKCDQTQNDD